ncbi:MAG: hypothetical protein B5M54_05665 [Candidatus Aminicenantes bacterium 4484_214]|nr:MAG: hypothetical protein B5M54_05665 [Candidatus Aminicenantes bacterium 4484_214]
MPIYEFYCEPCHTIFNFFSRTVNPTKVPQCPRCGNPDMKRKVSRFAVVSAGSSDRQEEEDGLPPLDEAKMEQAMSMLAREAEHIDEDDPRQAANLVRKLSEATGLTLGPGMEEALRRLEKGEDPEKIEEEMGDLLEEEDPFLLEKKGVKVRRRKETPPQIDETLYEL